MSRDVTTIQLVFQLWILLGVLAKGLASRRGDKPQTNRTLVFSTLIEPPFVQRVSTGTDVELAGFIPDLVHKLARRMRRPYDIKLVAIGGYGTLQDDGGWNGMIGEVMSGEADVAVGALSVRGDRERYVDFTVPYMTSGIATVVKKRSRGIVSPLELANQTAISYGVIPGSLTYNYFRYSNRSRTRTMWEYMISKQPTMFEWTSKSGVDRVRRSNGTYAFMVEKVFAEYLINQKPCDLAILDVLMNPSQYAFAVQKGSPLRHEINEALRALKQNGVIERLYKKWWRGECTKHRKKGRRKDRKDQKLSVQELPESDSNSELWISFIEPTESHKPSSTTGGGRGLNDHHVDSYDSYHNDATPNKRKDATSSSNNHCLCCTSLLVLLLVLLI